LLANHAEGLAKVVQKALLLCEVAALARVLQLESFGGGTLKDFQSISKFGITKEKFDKILLHNLQTDDDSSAVRGMSEVDDYMYNGGLIIDPSNSDPLRGNSDQSQRMKVNELLGAWYVVGIVVSTLRPSRTSQMSRLVCYLRLGRSRKLNWVPR
jgi:hypothetical protein